MKRWMIFAKCKEALINEKIDDIREMQKKPLSMERWMIFAKCKIMP